jgi:hypothetical protein
MNAAHLLEAPPHKKKPGTKVRYNAQFVTTPVRYATITTHQQPTCLPIAVWTLLMTRPAASHAACPLALPAAAAAALPRGCALLLLLCCPCPAAALQTQAPGPTGDTTAFMNVLMSVCG